MLTEKIKYSGVAWKMKSLLLKLFLGSQSVTLVKTLTSRLSFPMMDREIC